MEIEEEHLVFCDETCEETPRSERAKLRGSEGLEDKSEEDLKIKFGQIKKDIFVGLRWRFKSGSGWPSTDTNLMSWNCTDGIFRWTLAAYIIIYRCKDQGLIHFLSFTLQKTRGLSVYGQNRACLGTWHAKVRPHAISYHGIKIDHRARGLETNLNRGRPKPRLTKIGIDQDRDRKR